MIPQDIIDKVLDRADIVDVIDDYVKLTKKGRDYVACCPFHKEKTPSFRVSPSRQIWHCFGSCAEGGNVISFLMKHEAMSFNDAVRLLAKRYNIEIEEEQESSEAREARMKREALTLLNQRVADYYVQLINTKEGADAWNYGVSRFTTDYMKSAGIGWAPDKWGTLYDWAVSRGENIDMLIELGLLIKNTEKGTIYDAYRDRLMIPIRDRRRNIIGFTARKLSDNNDEVSKYKNSCESVLYHKSESVFGIDVAWKEGCKQELFYLVEGAPDAMKMHSVGIDNVVAPLGGAWTKEQLQMLKKASANICFINDADPVPQGKHYGTGIGFVIKNGAEAIRMGFNVYVREIPCKEGNLKQDPGDFFTDKHKMKELEEQDFVVWMADKLIHKDGAAGKKTDSIKEVAELVSFIADDMRIEMLLPELCRIYKGKELWRNSINKARWARQEAKETKEAVDLRKYGFYEQSNCYYGLGDKGDSQWSNFTMQPLFHIQDNESPKRLFYIKNMKGREEIVEMNMEELVSLSKFRQKVEGIGNYTWMGSDRDLMKLKSFLYDKTETARIIRQMGWHPAGFYAFGNGIWQDGDFHKADDFGVCRLSDSNWYIPAASKLYRDDAKKFERERKFIHTSLQSVKMGEYTAQFCRVHGDNGKVGLAYWIASLFRDIITSYTRSFPILDLFGPKGSGKTEMGAALMAFFVPDNKAPNLKNSTSTALNDDVAFVSNALVHLDEYKNDVRPDKIEFLKGLYDGVGRVKMSGSSYDSRIMTSVKSGIIMSGQEMPTADIALFHRCIYLSFPRSEFTIEERQRFAALREIQKLGLTSLTLEVLRCRKRVEANFLDTYNAVLDDINRITGDRKIETRIVENWAKALAAMRCVEDKIQLPFTYAELLKICCDGIVEQNKLSSTGNELAQFWKSIAFLLANGDIFATSDFHIKSMKTIDTDLTNKTFPDSHKVLMLNRTRIFTLYKQACLHSNETPLPQDSLQVYLENASYYLGKKHSVRFKNIIKGVKQTIPDGCGKYRDKESVMTAMCFDYEIICDMYDISLENEPGETISPYTLT